MAIYARPVKTNIKSNRFTAITADIYIEIVDQATQMPTNGNGVTVWYSVVTNGIPGPSTSVVVPGQSVLVFSGFVFYAGSGNVGGEALPDGDQIDSVDVVIDRLENAPPTELSCNLQFVSADVTKESGDGARDGSIVVTASSSYYPILYSLDNITFQASNKFTGLSTGVKTVYLKDGNSCTAFQSVFIDVKGGLLISDPSVNVEGNTSRWNAAFNPIVFKYQRKDYEVNSIVNTGGRINVSVNANLDKVAVGDLIYINTPKYEGTFAVVSKTVNTVVLDCGFISNDAGGFVNINSLKKYYKVLTKITYVDNDRLKSVVSTNTPNLKGITKVDLSTFLQTILKVKDSSGYNQANYRDSNLSASYQISYAEIWEGHGPDYINVSTPYYVLYAAGQLGQKMARNLSEYVPFKTLASPNNRAKFITDFKEPVYTQGKPFDIGFIYSDDLIGLEVTSKIESLDVNRQPTGLSVINGFLQNEDGSYILNQDLSRLIIASYPILSTTGQIIPEQLGLNRLLINTVFPSNVYYLALTLSYDTTEITQRQIIRINKDDGCNAEYLRWIGLTGSWNYWQFNYNQQHDLDVQNSVIIKRFVNDWQNEDTIEDVVSKAASEKITVTAEDLTIDDIKGLRSIKMSPKVQRYIDGKWITVVVNTGTFAEFETLYGTYQFKITYNLPSLNIQTQ